MFVWLYWTVENGLELQVALYPYYLSTYRKKHALDLLYIFDNFQPQLIDKFSHLQNAC